MRHKLSSMLTEATRHVRSPTRSVRLISVITKQPKTKNERILHELPPKGDAPLQGEDSHLHTQNVLRGSDGKGLLAMKCANCHQFKNLPGENMPPGHPEWHLPPANMRMVFEGKTPRQLARQLKDPKPILSI